MAVTTATTKDHHLIQGTVSALEDLKKRLEELTSEALVAPNESILTKLANGEVELSNQGNMMDPSLDDFFYLVEDSVH